MSESNKPLTWLLIGLTALYAAIYRLLPYDVAMYCLWPFTTFSLYCGARLRSWQAVAMVLCVQALLDGILYYVHQWPASWGTYLAFGLMPFIGQGLLKHSHSTVRIFSATTLGYVFFFLVSNTAAWTENALTVYEPKTFKSLLTAYAEGLEFIRSQPMQVFGQYVLALGVFTAHEILAKLWFPAEVVQQETAR